MKVLQVLPELNSGGVERGTLELSAYLASKGHESLVLSGGGRLVEKIEAAGGRHITLPVGRKSLLSLTLIPRLRKLMREENPDVVHVRSRVPAWLVWMAWKRMPADQRPRLVSTVHGFYSVNQWSAIMLWGERIICVSESIKAYVKTSYPKVAETLLRVVPRGVDPEHYPYGFKPDAAWRSAFEKEFPESRGKVLLTLPGRITRLKGHGDLIEILKRLSHRAEVHALVVGGAHPRKAAYLEEVHERVKSEGLGDRITFTGNRDDLREILSISTVVLSLTTQPESFGRTTLEALAMGVPVVGYDHGGVGEQLARLFPEGRVDPLDSEAAASTIDKLLDEPATVQHDNPFTLQRMLEGTVEVYSELLNEPSPESTSI